MLQQVESIANKTPMYSEREATRSLLQSCLSYSEEANTTVRPFQPDLVSLPQVGSSPPPLQDLVDDFGRDILKDPVGNMMLGPDESGHKFEKGEIISADMDVDLKHDPKKYVQFVHLLYVGGIITFTERPQDLMTPFFVANKNGRLRLVLDCCSINERFKEPPSISLAASWSQVEIPAGKELCVAQSDITDYSSTPCNYLKHYSPFLSSCHSVGLGGAPPERPAACSRSRRHDISVFQSGSNGLVVGNVLGAKSSSSASAH